MFKLNEVANKTEYAEHMGQDVLLGRKTVKVVEYTKDGKSGSWERGFKFSTTKYGGLYDEKAKKVSFDHGATWHWNSGSNYYDEVFRDTKTGRVRLASSSHGEFAFNKIQELNKQYFGPGYKWKP